jgi:hypothetical protein
LVASTGLAPAAALGAGASAEAVQAAVNLRPRFEVGKDVRLKIETNSVSDNEMPGGAGVQQTKDSQEFVVRLSPKDVSEGGATVELTYESLKASIEGSPRGPQTFDSAQGEDADNFAKALRPIVGLTLTLKLDANGNITEVTGGDVAGLNRRVPLASRLVTAPGVTALFGRVVSGNRSSGQASLGQSWQTVDTFDQGVMGKLKLTADNTLASHEGDKATINIKGVMALEADAGSPAMMTLKAGTYEGKAVWDTKAGMVHSMDVTQVVSLEGDTPVGRVATKRTTVEKVTRLEGDAAAPAAEPKAVVGE